MGVLEIVAFRTSPSPSPRPSPQGEGEPSAVGWRIAALGKHGSHTLRLPHPGGNPGERVGVRIPQSEISRVEPLNPDLRQSAVTGPCSAIRSLGRLFTLRSSRLCGESARPKSLGLSCAPPGQVRLRLGFGVAANRTQRREEHSAAKPQPPKKSKTTEYGRRKEFRQKNGNGGDGGERTQKREGDLNYGIRNTRKGTLGLT
jgi:hypothetical protein